MSVRSQITTPPRPAQLALRAALALVLALAWTVTVWNVGAATREDCAPRTAVTRIDPSSTRLPPSPVRTLDRRQTPGGGS